MNDPIPVRNEFFAGLTLALLLTAVTVLGIIGAVISSLWWLALPTVAYAVLAAEIWCHNHPGSRDEQLAQIVDLDELPDDDEVDLSLIDLQRWADAGATDTWRCDLEDGTGEK